MRGNKSLVVLLVLLGGCGDREEAPKTAPGERGGRAETPRPAPALPPGPESPPPVTPAPEVPRPTTPTPEVPPPVTPAPEVPPPATPAPEVPPPTPPAPEVPPAGRTRPSPPPAAPREPAPESRTTPPPRPEASDRGGGQQGERRRYTVARGDTLSGIAKRHGLDPRKLAEWNDIADPLRLRLGQEIYLDPPDSP